MADVTGLFIGARRSAITMTVQGKAWTGWSTGPTPSQWDGHDYFVRVSLFGSLVFPRATLLYIFQYLGYDCTVALAKKARAVDVLSITVVSTWAWACAIKCYCYGVLR